MASHQRMRLDAKHHSISSMNDGRWVCQCKRLDTLLLLALRQTCLWKGVSEPAGMAVLSSARSRNQHTNMPEPSSRPRHPMVRQVLIVDDVPQMAGASLPLLDSNTLSTVSASSQDHGCTGDRSDRATASQRKVESRHWC